MFLAGDDENAKSIVSPLVGELGFEALDAGALKQARILEPLAMVWINQALIRGLGRNWAFGVIQTIAEGFRGSACLSARHRAPQQEFTDKRETIDLAFLVSSRITGRVSKRALHHHFRSNLIECLDYL